MTTNVRGSRLAFSRNPPTSGPKIPARLSEWGAGAALMSIGGTLLKRKCKATSVTARLLAIVLVSALGCQSTPTSGPGPLQLRREAALAAEGRGDWEEAAGIWSELVLADDPLWREACLGAVASFRQLRDLYGAQGMLELGLRRAPDDAELQELHAEVLLDLGFRRAAEDRLTTVLEQHPERTRSLLLLARARFELGLETRALQALDQLVSLQLACPETWYLRGRCNQNLGRTLEAYEDFRHAFEARDISPDRLLCAASLYVDSGVRGDERARYLSLSWLHRVVEENPQCCDAFYLLGLIQEEAGSDRRALESYRRAVELDPTSVVYLTSLAEMYAKLGQVDDARGLAQQALALGGGPPSQTRRLRRLLDK